MSLTKEQIFGVRDIQTEKVSVPEWGGDVYVKMLSARERDAFEQSVARVTRPGQDVNLNLENVRARFCALVMCDENGLSLFKEADAVELGKRSSVAIDRVWEAGQRLNAMGRGNVEDVEKNSAPIPVADSC